MGDTDDDGNAFVIVSGTGKLSDAVSNEDDNTIAPTVSPIMEYINTGTLL